MKINEIKNPQFLKTYSNKQLENLSNEIRDFLVDTVSKTGGHLSSNLGTVELTVAIHKVFNSPTDKILFDVGHQSYTHKILTGRANQFSTLRQYGGLSGFQKTNESEHDPFEAGHAGTALSTAFGMAVARDLDKKKFNIISVVGDGVLTNGMIYEAINHIGELSSKVIMIINDNEMSISKNVGYINSAFSQLSIAKPYVELKEDLNKVLSKGGMITKPVRKAIVGVRNSIRKTVVTPNVFSDFGMKYIGPFNGHNIPDLIKALEYAKNHNGSIVIHVKTIKGKGYKPSEEDAIGVWHGVSQFDPNTGESSVALPEGVLSYSSIISETLIRLAKNDPDIVAITPAMIVGSKLEKFFEMFPNRSFDTGISEGHALTFASGLALSHKKPFVSIYSTFLQRAYDQINHDITRMNLPVVIGIDRAGIVGEDGETHHGLFDIGLLRPLPNLVIAQPKNSDEAQHLLYTAFRVNRPFALRYPRGNDVYKPVSSFMEIEVGSWELLKLSDQNPHAIIMSYGKEVELLKEKIESNGFNWWVVNMRFIKPFDTILLKKLFEMDTNLYIYETDYPAGGLSEAVQAFAQAEGNRKPIEVITLGDNYIPHGSMAKLRQVYGIDINSCVEKVMKSLKEKAE